MCSRVDVPSQAGASDHDVAVKLLERDYTFHLHQSIDYLRYTVLGSRIINLSTKKHGQVQI